MVSNGAFRSCCRVELVIWLVAGKRPQADRGLLLQTYTGQGMKAKDANQLPSLVAEGKATRIELDAPICIHGSVSLL